MARNVEYAASVVQSSIQRHLRSSIQEYREPIFAESLTKYHTVAGEGRRGLPGPFDVAGVVAHEPDADGMEIREWDMEPGDAVACNFMVPSPT